MNSIEISARAEARHAEQTDGSDGHVSNIRSEGSAAWRYAIYAGKPNSGEPSPQPAPFQILRWEPGIFSRLPSEFRQLRRVPHLFRWFHLVYWRLHRLLPLGRGERFFAIYFALQDDQLVHYSVVSSGDFRFPFMKAREAQIGPVWTRPDSRRKGLAVHVGQRIQSDIAAMFDRVWWICASDNSPSCQTAVRMGLRYVGGSHHTSKLGLRVLGQYVLHTDSAEDAPTVIGLTSPAEGGATRVGSRSRRTTAAETIPDFSTITETPNVRITAEQLRVMYTRYDLASKYALGKDVLEVACGAGMGLGLLSRVARRTIGGDIDERNCAVARQTYRDRNDLEIKQLDAQTLPFPDASFDVVILYEALYYIPSAEAFFREARRVLRPGGTLLISTVNCRWGEFNASPFSIKYYDAAELADGLVRHGFRVEIYGGFPAGAAGPLHRAVGLVRKIAVRLHLVPKTMKGKEWLKRLFYGQLKPIPAELVPGLETPAPLDKLLRPYSADQYRFVYAIGVLP